MPTGSRVIEGGRRGPGLAGGAAIGAIALAACGGEAIPPGPPVQGQALAALPDGSPGRIALRRADGHPRLTLVTRDGDPSPAVAVVLATGAGPAVTAALAAVVEARVHAAGFDPEVRIDRDAFRLRLLLADAARAPALFAAIAAAASRPVTPGSAEIALAVTRVRALARNPLDAAELSPVSACTGALGVPPGEPLPDLGTEAGARDLDAVRRAVLHAGSISIAAVGPAAFGAAVEGALDRSSGWPPAPGAAAEEPWPAADAAGAYVAPSLDRHRARVTIAVRVPDPQVAAAAAERMAAGDSPLVARLRLLPEPWRLVQVAGVARARGGCVSAVIETPERPVSPVAETDAALAAGVARREMLAEIAAPPQGAVAARQILTALDPREAASRAAWWALSASAPGAPLRWATALGLPPSGDLPPREAGSAARPGARAEDLRDATAAARFRAELDRAVAAAGVPAVERRVAVERGQGELWLLLASPCGVAEEGAADAGLGAVATIAEVEAQGRRADVTIEPWITSDGLGVLAHAAPRDDRETAEALARRVADAAARALTATAPTPEAFAAARAAVLDHLERADGRHGAAFDALAPLLSPDHPAWIEPFGVWSRVAGAGPDAARIRGRALAEGPLRVAVIADADAAQAAVAGDAVDRWLAPSPGPRLCRPGPAAAPRPGRAEVRLPPDAPLAQVLVGAPMPAPSAPGRDLAELTAAALDGPGGLLAQALAGSGGSGSARIVGGSRAPALVVDARVPDAGAAAADVEALLARLPAAASEADLTRAALALERRGLTDRADPRQRLVDLWLGRRPRPPAARPTLAAWRAFLSETLREGSLVVVEARGE